MTFDEYIMAENDPRRAHGPVPMYRVEAPTPWPAPSTRPTAPSRRAPSPAAPARSVGYRSDEPWRVCLICHEPAPHLAASRLLCASCQAEVSWRVALARQGLRVVS